MKRLSLEARHKVSVGVKKAWEEGRLSKPPPRLNEISPELWRDNLSRGVKRAWEEGRRKSEMPEEVRAKLAESTHRAWIRGELRGYPHKEETKKLLSLRTRQAYKEGKLPPKPPTKLEKDLEAILERNFPGEWKYTGDGKITIEGYRPDFINCAGRKLIIEAYGLYWHDAEEEEERKELFARYGYKTLIIWEPEDRRLPEDEIITKIRNFME